MPGRNRVTLQEPVSRPDSMGQQLSDLSWARGIGNFFIEGVPFSYSTSTDLAHRIIQFMQAMFPNTKSNAIYELGAGLGLLSRNICLLLTKEPGLKKKTKVYVSDYSEAMFAQIEKLQLFSEFKDQVEFKVLDFNDLEFDKSPLPNLVILSYLLDSLPTKQYEYSAGKLYELKVKTTVSDTQTMLDTTEFPPKLIHVKKIKIKPPIISALQPLLKESLVKVPVEDALVSAFLEMFNPKKKTVRFNFSHMAYQGLEKLLAGAKDPMAILIYDFGYPHLGNDQALTKNYGPTLCFSMVFDLFRFVAKRNSANCFIGDNAPGKSSFILLTKHFNKSKVEPVFTKLFQKDPLPPIQKAIAKINEIEDDFKEELAIAIKPLTLYQQQNYSLLSTIVEKCMGLKMLTAAQTFANHNIGYYKATALSMITAISDIHYRKKEYKQAIEELKTGLSLSEGDPYMLHILANCLWETKKTKSFIEVAKQYYRYSGNLETVDWHLMAKMILAYRQLQKPVLEEELRRWILTSPIIPKKTTEKIKNLI